MEMNTRSELEAREASSELSMSNPPVRRGSGGKVLPQRLDAQVKLGTYEVDEIQICEMGSWGPEGEYVCVGKITL